MWNYTGGNYYCSVYSGDTTCCQQGEGVFYLGDFVNVTTIGGAIGPGLSTSTAFSSTSTSATIASTTASTPVTSSSPASKSGDSGLGEGTETGIGVGITLGVIVLVAFGYLTWRDRKSTMKLREQVQMLAERGNEVQNDLRYEQSGVKPFHDPGAAPYHDQGRYELGGIGSQTAELPVEDQRIRGR